MANYNLEIFTENIEGEALNQIYEIAKSPAMEGAKIRIMPDVHAGKGCVIGFTATNYKNIIPNIVGVDLGCGMRVVELGNIDINYEKLDNVIRTFVPSGMDVHEHQNGHILKEVDKLLDDLHCNIGKEGRLRAEYSVGTLGGGNHFIEIDADKDNNKYLVIHTGSRNLGTLVANLYQKKAVKYCTIQPEERRAIIDQCIAEGREQDIECELLTFKQNRPYIPPEQAYLSHEDGVHYLHDVRLVQKFAELNRQRIAQIILEKMNWKQLNSFTTIHNYVDFYDDTIRKGSISAQTNEKVLIPLNMRDGCIIGYGKGNTDWNYSAPHGAGRLMSRAAAKEAIKLEDFEASMKGIYTTSVGYSTLDESPFAYKPAQEIIDLIEDTITIDRIIKPVYNFKAS